MKESLFGKLIMVIDESVRVWVRRIFNEQSKLIPVSKDEPRMVAERIDLSYDLWLQFYISVSASLAVFSGHKGLVWLFSALSQIR